MTDNYTAAAIYWMKTFTSKVREKVKKEMWKVKLIELLNEYNWKESYWLDEDSISWEHYINRWDGNQCFINEHIISKKFWFIKWLVENDKIEFREDFYLEDQHWGWFGEDEDIIMLLSIQDNPIEFLISILK